jgi:hypothetical protein
MLHLGLRSGMWNLSDVTNTTKAVINGAHL